MMKKTRSYTILYIGALVSLFGGQANAFATAPEGEGAKEANRWSSHFTLQTDWHLARTTEDGKRPLSGITYLEGTLRNKFLEFGARLEEKSHPLPGRDEERGRGLTYFYGRGRYRGWDLTLGDFYEQFGSGLLFRSYEDRFLGLDNAVRGVRLNYSVGETLRLKSFAGQQRHYFDRGARLFARERGFLAGGDAELSLERFLPSLREQGGTLLFGASLLHKHEAEDELATQHAGQVRYLKQPTGTWAWAARGALNLPSFSLSAEYAHKDYDPNRTNAFIFRPGSSAMVTATYLFGRSSLFLGARRSENFDFRSERLAEGNALRVNFLQPFTKQQTYTLAAFYPYGTQPSGEWAFQGAFDTSIADHAGKPRSKRTNVKVYASLMMGLKNRWLVPEGALDPLAPQLMGTDGYTTDFFGMKELRFREVGLELSRKVSASYSFVLGYINQAYNQRRLEGHASNGDIIHSNIFIYDGRHRLSRRVTLRTELQYFQSRQAAGDWVYGAVECSILPHFILSASDLWNHGTTRDHYYMVALAGSWMKHTARISYGRTCAGMNCSGGICRYLPETHGLYLAYLLNL